MLKSNILKSSDTIEVKNIVLMIYGQPGIGKTSLSQTADKPFTLDYDNGIHRSGFRKDSLVITSWDDASEIDTSDIEDYSTIVIDTVGRQLDFLAANLISKNAKLGYNGALSLQGYGQLKSIFAAWIRRVKTMGKDIILISHDKEDKKGDNVIVRPDIQGGSYAEVFKIADSVGYMYKARDIILDFNPTESWVGKNTAQFAPLTIPDFTKRPTYMDEIIRDIKSHMNSLSAEQMIVREAVDGYRARISEIIDAKAMNTLYDEIKPIGKAQQSQVKKLMQARVADLGLEFDKKKGKFYMPEAEENAS